MIAIVLAALLAVQGSPFTLTSPDLPAGQPLPAAQVFNGFGCTGPNVSPRLEWAGAPAGTKSFAVTVYDPDAPTGSGWWHCVVFNIPSATTVLEAGAGTPGSSKAPKGAVQSRTDFGAPGFGGACPPPGDRPHRYIFTVHALKVDSLPLDANAPRAMVGYYLTQNTIAKASLTRTYGR
ncbi:YbhB/YbcL family Raf kinase inhibitor-like protein [Luteitalea sp.]